MCLSVSAFWAFMWFVGFCLLANQWQVSKPDNNPLQEGGDAARAAIAFSFFSIFTWVCTGCYFFGFSESGLRKDFLFLEVMWLWYQAFVCVCVSGCPHAPLFTEIEACVFRRGVWAAFYPSAPWAHTHTCKHVCVSVSLKHKFTRSYRVYEETTVWWEFQTLNILTRRHQMFIYY